MFYAYTVLNRDTLHNGAYQQWVRKTWNIIIQMIHYSNRTEVRNDRIVTKSFTKRVCTGVKKFCEMFRMC